jgi:tetratricopeptide (TPR) repeat protein
VSLSESEDREPITTSGAIAVVNLSAQIDGLAVRAALLGTAESLILIDLLTLRGHTLGRIADYEWAEDFAEQLVRRTTDCAGMAFLARARTRAIFHRFTDALAELEAAEQHGLDRATLAAERAEILQAVGRHEQAIELNLGVASRRPEFATLGALAVIHAQLGHVAEAERLFTKARCQYPGTSPFPLASLDFRRGVMWYGKCDLPAARIWFEASRRRVPAYAPALGHLAEIAAALGAHEAAIDRLHPVVSSSDDPEYAATLASTLRAAGHPRDAEPWRVRAAARYEELALRHPEAFAEHAAEFRRHAGC